MNTISFVGEKPKSFGTRWHTHENWEFIFCTSGQGAVRFRDGNIIPYHAGEMVVIPPKVSHKNSCEEGFSSIYMNVMCPSFTYQGAFKIQDENGSLYKAFGEARVYFTSDKIKRELILESLGDLIISYIIVFRCNSVFSEPVEQIRRSIRQNYTSTEYALEECLNSLPFNYDYLRKVFKKETGMSPLEYMTSLRMKNAERLLSTVWTSGYTVADIAQLCGYDNALYFTRVFKKFYGCSPTQYVKKLRETQALDG